MHYAQCTLTFHYIIVWLDENIASSDCCHQLKQAFTTAVNPDHELPTSIDALDIDNLIYDPESKRGENFCQVPCKFELFDDIDQCYKFLLANTNKRRIFFLTSFSCLLKEKYPERTVLL